MILPTFVKRRKPSQTVAKKIRKPSQTFANSFPCRQEILNMSKKMLRQEKRFATVFEIICELFAKVCDGLQRLANVSEIMGVDP